MTFLIALETITLTALCECLFISPQKSLFMFQWIDVFLVSVLKHIFLFCFVKLETNLATHCDAFLLLHFMVVIYLVVGSMQTVDRYINLIDKFRFCQPSIGIRNTRASFFSGISWVSDKIIETDTRWNGNSFDCLSLVAWLLSVKTFLIADEIVFVLIRKEQKTQKTGQ